MSAIFVDRPRLAIVIAVVTTIAGLLALYAILALAARIVQRVADRVKPSNRA